MNKKQEQVLEVAIKIAIFLFILIAGYWILKIIWRIVVTMAPHLVSTSVIITFQVITVACSAIIALEFLSFYSNIYFHGR